MEGANEVSKRNSLLAPSSSSSSQQAAPSTATSGPAFVSSRFRSFSSLPSPFQFALDDSSLRAPLLPIDSTGDALLHASPAPVANKSNHHVPNPPEMHQQHPIHLQPENPVLSLHQSTTTIATTSCSTTTGSTTTSANATTLATSSVLPDLVPSVDFRPAVPVSPLAGEACVSPGVGVVISAGCRSGVDSSPGSCPVCATPISSERAPRALEAPPTTADGLPPNVAPTLGLAPCVASGASPPAPTVSAGRLPQLASKAAPLLPPPSRRFSSTPVTSAAPCQGALVLQRHGRKLKRRKNFPIQYAGSHHATTSGKSSLAGSEAQNGYVSIHVPAASTATRASDLGLCGKRATHWHLTAAAATARRRATAVREGRARHYHRPLLDADEWSDSEESPDGLHHAEGYNDALYEGSLLGSGGGDFRSCTSASPFATPSIESPCPAACRHCPPPSQVSPQGRAQRPVSSTASWSGPYKYSFPFSGEKPFPRVNYSPSLPSLPQYSQQAFEADNDSDSPRAVHLVVPSETALRPGQNRRRSISSVTSSSLKQQPDTEHTDAAKGAIRGAACPGPVCDATTYLDVPASHPDASLSGSNPLGDSLPASAASTSAPCFYEGSAVLAPGLLAPEHHQSPNGLMPCSTTPSWARRPLLPRRRKLLVLEVAEGRCLPFHMHTPELLHRVHMHNRKTAPIGDEEAGALKLRDLRQIVSGHGVQRPSLEARRNTIVVNLPPIRCLILVDCVLIIPSFLTAARLAAGEGAAGLDGTANGLLDDVEGARYDVDLFEKAEEELVNKLIHITSTQLDGPFEFSALEASLVCVCSCLGGLLLPVKGAADGVISAIFRTPGCAYRPREVTALRRRLDCLRDKLRGVGGALKEVLDNEVYLQRMEFSIKRVDAGDAAEKPNHHTLFDMRNRVNYCGTPTLEGNKSETQSEMRQLPVGDQQLWPHFQTLTSTICSEAQQWKNGNFQDLQILLECYEQEIQSMTVVITRLDGGLDDALQLVQLHLASVRNTFLKSELGLDIISVVIAFVSAIASLLGMNLHSGLESEKPTIFWGLTAALLSVCAVAACLVFVAFRNMKM
eukprot:GHVT01066439.1.p1 GENE.GHVT01066439.1~~GHVT01066439.1.p1  ORF type:complete len:1075 (-),score=212.91 GHVT01066439.1:303-3527(-)